MDNGIKDEANRVDKHEGLKSFLLAITAIAVVVGSLLWLNSIRSEIEQNDKKELVNSTRQKAMEEALQNQRLSQFEVTISDGESERVVIVLAPMIPFEKWMSKVPMKGAEKITKINIVGL